MSQLPLVKEVVPLFTVLKLAGTRLATRPQHTAEAPVDSRLFDHFYKHLYKSTSFVCTTDIIEKDTTFWSTLVVGASTAFDDDGRHLSETNVYDI